MRHPRNGWTAALLLAAATLCLAAEAGAQPVPRVFLPRANRLLAVDDCKPVMDPPEMRANTGGTLAMAPSTFQVGTSTYNTNVYNGSYLAPTLRIDPGQQLQLTVANNMRATANQTDSMVKWTNQHYHGFIVTPLPPSGDNVTNVRIDQGATNRYVFPVDMSHAQGMMWYHPHPHLLTSNQVGGGLAGAFLLGDVRTYFPTYRNVPERVFLIRDLGSLTGGATSQLNINGSTCARVDIPAGQAQLWHVGNFSANTFVNLKVKGYQFRLLALDGNRLPVPMAMDSIFLSPGSRADAIIVGGRGPQQAQIVSAPFVTGTSGNLSKEVSLGWLNTVGVAQTTENAVAAMEAQAASRTDQELADSVQRLITAPDVNRFKVAFQLNGGKLQLNNATYDHDSVSVIVPVGQVQEWTLVNQTTFLHTFHIHQTDFVVPAQAGVTPPVNVHLDNAYVGVQRDPGSGRIVGDSFTVRFKFTPVASGPFVFHCHVLAHEDAGMMANVCVYDPAKGETPETCRQWFRKGPWGSGTASGGDAAAPGSGHGEHGSLVHAPQSP